MRRCDVKGDEGIVKFVYFESQKMITGELGFFMLMRYPEDAKNQITEFLDWFGVLYEIEEINRTEFNIKILSRATLRNNKE